MSTTTEDGSRTVITAEGVSISHNAKETVSIEVTPNCMNIHVSHFGEVAVIQVSKEEARELINAVGTVLKLDTGKTSRLIASDDMMHNRAIRLWRSADSTQRLAYLLENAFEDIIYDDHRDIDIGAIDWDVIASEYMEE